MDNVICFFLTMNHFTESLIYPFGSRPADAVLSSSIQKEQPLTVPVLIDKNQIANLTVDGNFTLCFNFSDMRDVKMYHDLKDDGRTISIDMEKILSIDIRNIFWIENENVTCMVIENASFIKIEHAPTLKTNDIIRVATLSCISLISVVGNIAVLTTVAVNRRRRQSSIYLLISMLAIADLLVTTFCVITDAIWAYTVEWLADNTTCKLVKFFQMFSLYFSTFLLLIIGYDRYKAIRFPMKRANARRDIRRMLFGIVVLSAIFSTPQVSSLCLYYFQSP